MNSLFSASCDRFGMAFLASDPSQPPRLACVPSVPLSNPSLGLCPLCPTLNPLARLCPLCPTLNPLAWPVSPLSHSQPPRLACVPSVPLSTPSLACVPSIPLAPGGRLLISTTCLRTRMSMQTSRSTESRCYGRLGWGGWALSIARTVQRYAAGGFRQSSFPVLLKAFPLSLNPPSLGLNLPSLGLNRTPQDPKDKSRHSPSGGFGLAWAVISSGLCERVDLYGFSAEGGGRYFKNAVRTPVAFSRGATWGGGETSDHFGAQESVSRVGGAVSPTSAEVAWRRGSRLADSFNVGLLAATAIPRSESTRQGWLRDLDSCRAVTPCLSWGLLAVRLPYVHRIHRTCHHHPTSMNNALMYRSSLIRCKYMTDVARICRWSTWCTRSAWSTGRTARLWRLGSGCASTTRVV
eukprot:1195152-Prorocentrum_minimum.AAC.4